MVSIGIPHGALIPVVSVAAGWVIAILVLAGCQDRFPGAKKALYSGVIICALAFLLISLVREKPRVERLSSTIGLLGSVLLAVLWDVVRKRFSRRLSRLRVESGLTRSLLRLTFMMMFGGYLVLVSVVMRAFDNDRSWLYLVLVGSVIFAVAVSLFLNSYAPLKRLEE